MDKGFDGAPYAGKRVLVSIHEPIGANLKCKAGTQFEGVISDHMDQVLGLYYVTLSDADARIVGAKCVTLGWTATIVGELDA